MARLGFATRPRFEQMGATLCMLRHGYGCCKAEGTQGRALTSRKTRCGAARLSHLRPTESMEEELCSPVKAPRPVFSGAHLREHASMPS